MLTSRYVTFLIGVSSIYALEKPSAGAIGQLIPSLANAFLSTLFPKLQLPKEASQNFAMNGPQPGGQGYPQQAMYPQQQQPMYPQQQQPMYEQQPNMGMMPHAPVGGLISPVGMPRRHSGNPYELQRRLMTLNSDTSTFHPGDSSSSQQMYDAQSGLAQTLWQQSGRDGQPSADANFDNLPPSDFAHGYPPTFGRLSNPENQDLFEKPQGLQGRRDLPPTYVYPFAKAGSVLRSRVPSGEAYSLGNDMTPLTDADKLFAMANPNLFYPQKNVPMTPELLAAIERNEKGQVDAKHVGAGADPRVVRMFMEKARQVGLETGALRKPLSLIQRPKVDQSAEATLKEEEVELCSQCVNADLEKMVGPWTQIYGNAKSLKIIYTTLSNVNQLMDKSAARSSGAAVIPSCAGLQVSRPQGQRHFSEVELAFAERGGSALRKLQGVLSQNRNISAHGKALEISLPGFKMPLCLVKSGPSTSTMYNYMVLTELSGANRCRSHHVFARRSDFFERDDLQEVGKYLKEEFENKRMAILSALKQPDACLAW